MIVSSKSSQEKNKIRHTQSPQVGFGIAKLIHLFENVLINAINPITFFLSSTHGCNCSQT